MRIGFELHRSGFQVLSIDWFLAPDIGMRSYFLTFFNLVVFLNLDDESKYPKMKPIPFSEDENHDR